jgi:hypothetical protein
MRLERQGHTHSRMSSRPARRRRIRDAHHHQTRSQAGSHDTITAGFLPSRSRSIPDKPICPLSTRACAALLLAYAQVTEAVQGAVDGVSDSLGAALDSAVAEGGPAVDQARHP